jgi:ABC-type polysaccharide/polyol phosphate export permease
MISNVGNIVARRDLLRELIRSELAASSAESSLGWLWWLVDPLLLMLIYSGMVYLIRGGGKLQYSPYPIFIFCALITWKHFAVTAQKSGRILISRDGLIKAVPFPTMILPLSQVISNFLFFLFGFVVLVAMSLIWRSPQHTGSMLPLVQVPALMLLQLVIVAGICLPLSCVAVLFKDIPALMGHIIRIGFYVSPGLYGIDMVRQALAERTGDAAPLLFNLYMLNPFAILITGYRDAVFYGRYLEPGYWGILVLEAAILIVAGYLIYQHYDRRVIKFL